MAGFAKAYNLGFEQVLSMSYANMVLYGATIPSYSSKRKGKSKNGRRDDTLIQADNPANKELVRDFLKKYG